MTTQTIPVFMVTNTDMVAYTATTMASVLYNTKSNIDFYIMDCGLSDFDKKQLSSIKDRFSNMESISFSSVDITIFEGMATWYFNSYDAWAMLLFPKAFPKVKKVVHIESDTILVNDIADLYNESLDKYVVGACPDIAFSQGHPLFKSPTHKYFNLGMILIDCVKWQKNNITDKCLNLGKKYGKEFNCLHQDALNMVFEDNYKVLPNRYNLGERDNYIKQLFSDLSDDYFANEWRHPYLIHFSPNKPWRTQNSFYSGRTAKYFNEWWFYAAMTPYIEGLRNSFIATRISDGFKGLKLGVDDYGNCLMDTLRKDHPWKNLIVEKGKFIVKDAHPLEQGGITIKNNLNNTLRYKLFNFLPLLKVKIGRSGTICYKLFDFLPLVKIKTKANGSKKYKLFNFIPLFKIKKK